MTKTKTKTMLGAFRMADTTNRDVVQLFEQGKIIYKLSAIFNGKRHAIDKLLRSKLVQEMQKHPDKFCVIYINSVDYEVDVESVFGFFETDKQLKAFIGDYIVTFEELNCTKKFSVPPKYAKRVLKQIMLEKL
jgi:hypothetical protein